jgi:flagellar protein FlaJ
MSALHLLPLLLALALAVVVVGSSFDDRLDVLTARVALALFGSHVAERNARRSREIAQLRSAHVGETHRLFAARSLLFAGLLGVAGAVAGVYLVAGLLFVLAERSASLRSLAPEWIDVFVVRASVPAIPDLGLFLQLLVGAAIGAAVFAFGGYWARWQFVDQRAVARASQIDATLPRTIAFVYALSRSGMAFPDILKTLTRNQGVYGEAARELGVAVREIDTFGTDMLSALQSLSDRTPSDDMEEFGENLASVLGSGRSLSTFLRQQYERYQEEAEAQQERYLELVGTLAEVYVTVLVAGPLFFVTVLVVIGLVLSDTLPVTRFVAYVAIPLASAGFLVYVDSIAQSVGVRGEYDSDRERDSDATDGARLKVMPDGGVADRWRASQERLRAYDRLADVRDWLERPVDSVLRHPEATFAVTIPLALAFVVVRAGQIPLGTEAVGVVDEPAVLGAGFVLGVYALLYEFQKRRVRAIEREVPDFLDRMASVNEAGVTIVATIHRVADSDLGALGDEIARVRRDMHWGADAGTALRRMERRVGTPMVSRAVTLITNAMSASSDVAPVLRIAATEAQDTRRLRDRRRDEMLTYLIVIYISFFVFLAIVVALATSFIPAIEAATSGVGGSTQQSVGANVSSGLLSGSESVNVRGYEQLLFHISAIQGLCSGLVAGKLAEGTIQDGLKHATATLALTYLVFQFV